MNKKIKEKFEEAGKLTRKKNNATYVPLNKLILHNYPPSSPNTFSYVCPLYREHKDIHGWKDVEGDPIYFHDMNDTQLSLAIILGNAENALYDLLKNKFTLG